MQIEDFLSRLGILFKDMRLVRQAFTHRSYVNEHRGEVVEHNERLEFLGDAVLELAVTDFLYGKYPESTEGELTSYRAALVNTNSISEAATELGMNDHLLLSKGESKDTGRARQYILANTFEAFIGALYLDQGYAAAQVFIANALFHKAENIVAQRLWQDAKSRFQEMAQEKEGHTPSYEMLEESGPDHDKHFVAGIYIGEKLVARGEGSSKQEAEQSAAEAGLKAKSW